MTLNDVLSNIDNRSQFLLIIWSIFLAATLFTYFKKPSLLPYSLFFAAVSIAAAFALFSPHLFPWDEQFHALVGKNVAENPFTSKLIPSNPIDTEQKSWTDGTIWLHKQPLFTWQIACSIKFFGLNSFAVRLPSVLFHGILVITIFKIGTIVFNKRTGFIASLMTMHSAYLLGLISGRIGTDHNDFIFLCYITLSFWAWFEWRQTCNKKWIYWIGIFAGCAVLTKWLVGLLVFAGWGMVVIPELKKGFFWQQIKPMAIAFGVTFLIFIPWQFYTYFRFPVEFKREMTYNSLHVSRVIENHSGDTFYHFNRLGDIYFNTFDFSIIFLISLGFLIISKKVTKWNKVFILSVIIVLYTFFALVNTKMPSFTLPVFGFITLIIAFGITEVAGLIKQRQIQGAIAFVLSLLLINWFIEPVPTLTHYAFYQKDRENLDENNLFKGYHFIKKNEASSTKRIVFGVDFFPDAHISWMFFNNEIAYPFLPSEDQVRKAHQKGYSVAIIVKSKETKFIDSNKLKIDYIYFK